MSQPCKFGCRSLAPQHPGSSQFVRRILQTLRVRYTLDMIYTYSGNILIAVRAPLSKKLLPRHRLT